MSTAAARGSSSRDERILPRAAGVGELDASRRRADRHRAYWDSLELSDCALALVDASEPVGPSLWAEPNPLRARAVIRYTLASSARVDLDLYDVAGQCVATLVRGRQSRGGHEVELRGARLPSGVYFCRLRVDDRVATQRLVILR